MPNIAAVLKNEISRLARKELRSNTESLKKAIATYRGEIASLKRRVRVLERQANANIKSVGRDLVADMGGSAPALRFRPDGLKKHRERLGLSAAQVAKILGCSTLSVYKWESGKARPRAKQLESIAQLRTLGKREAAKRLEDLTEVK